MDKYGIVQLIENFAPLETAENWDCSGWMVNVPSNKEVNTVMLCLTVTNDVVCQARNKNCDMIVSHHPLFFVPLEWKDIGIYCAHTNLDKALGGTTDTLIETLGFDVSETYDFVRYVETDISVEDLAQKLVKISPNLKYVNIRNLTHLKKIGFCAGSGSDFIQEASNNGADAFVTGDIKFHTAVESPIVLFDIGHFESEILVLNVLAKLFSNKFKVIKALEKSPFENVFKTLSDSL